MNELLNGKLDLITSNIPNKEIYYNQINEMTKKEILNQQRENHALIEDYHFFQNEVLKLIEELNIGKEDIDILFIIEYLIFNGYLSSNKHIELLNNHNDFEIIGCLGINVISSKACCRNVGGFYEELIQNRCTYPTCFSGKMTTHKFLNHWNHNNHYINLIYFNNTLFGIDLINHDLYFFVQKNILYSYKSKKYLIYSSFADLFLRGKTIQEIQEQLNLFQEYTHIDLDIISDINAKQERIIQNLENKKDILENFHINTNPIKQEIKNKVLSKK